MVESLDVIRNITSIEPDIVQQAQERLDILTKPQGSLGMLEDLAKKIVAITGNINPTLKEKVIFTLAADHGVVEEEVSAFPQEVTKQMVYNFLKGGAAINVLAKHVGARIVVADVGIAGDLEHHQDLLVNKIGYGTANMAVGPAMTRADALRSVDAGIKMFEEDLKNRIDVVGTGEMGIGNTTSASAITAVFTTASVEDVVGRGTGIDEKGLSNKIKAIKKAIAVNSPDPDDPIDVLAKVGGFEIGGLAGIILAAASNRIPVVIDGFISGAASLIAYYLEPTVKNYMIAGHCSAEKGHRVILDHIGLDPVLDLKMRLGEGTGAVLAFSLLEASTKILTRMATFEDADVSTKE
jgi:nicotinate-nucleotide--dimethylbenzimidazole phosphoribosyltransferase